MSCHGGENVVETCGGGGGGGRGAAAGEQRKTRTSHGDVGKKTRNNSLES